MRMGMVNRGAFLGWLSQFPNEREILIPVRPPLLSAVACVLACASSLSLSAAAPQPLTGLEVQDFERLKDGTLVYTMGVNINLQSMTIEEVLAVRKKQCRELAAVVGRSLKRERDEASAREGLGKQIARQSMEARAIEARDGAWFNENSNFVACVHALVPSPPPSRRQPLPFLPPCAWLRIQPAHRNLYLIFY